MQVLRELAELGMGLARTVQAQAIDQASGASAQDEGALPAWARGADLGLTFARIARAVRQTVALEAKLYRDRQAGHDKARAERAVETRLRGIRRKAKVIEIVERVVERESDAERLLDDLDERLQDEDDADFADRPLGELVARICRDLGVTPDWSLWADEAWASEAAAEPPPAPASTDYPLGEPPLDDPERAIEGEVRPGPGWNSA